MSNNNGSMVSDDMFSRRGIRANNLIEAQYGLAWEDLIRKNFPKLIKEEQFLFVPENPITAQKELELLKAIYSKLGIEDITYRRNVDYDIGRHARGLEKNVVTVFGKTGQVLGVKEGLVVVSNVDEINDSDEDLVNSIAITIVNSADEDIPIIDIVSEFDLKLYEKVPENEQIRINFAFPGPHGAIIKDGNFDPIPFDQIKQNYSPEVEIQLNKVIKNIQSSNKGLVILNGDPGTGKSYLIRSLLSMVKERRGVVCIPAIKFLSDIQQLIDVLSNNRRSMIILEDAGDLAAIDTVTNYFTESSNLLNLSEGLLSLLADNIFIITFNYDIDKINSALLRPGRCLGQIETTALTHKQAQELVGFSIPNEYYTLAEVYEMKRTGKLLKDGTGNIRKTLFDKVHAGE